jgi:hypothetical protein
MILISFSIVVSNPATLSGLEPIGGSSEAVDHPLETSSISEGKCKSGFVLGGGLPSIPAEIMKNISANSYIELSDLLPERIQDTLLFPDSRKRKSPVGDKVVDWVLAFCTYGQAIVSLNLKICGDLLTFIGTCSGSSGLGPSWPSLVSVRTELSCQYDH